jgi:hypothetical protein
VLSPAEYFTVPAEGIVDYQYAAVPRSETDRAFQEGRWVQSAQLLPSDRSVVHHAHAFILAADADLNNMQAEDRKKILGAISWVPGDPAFALPEGVGMFIPKNAQIYFQIHYTPNGKETQERPSLGLTFSKTPPRRALQMMGYFNTRFKIPPGNAHHTADSFFTLKRDALLLSMAGHMHVRAKSFSQEATFPDGRRLPLLSIPRYDFEWQTVYSLKEPILLPSGTRLHARGIWDNSVLNPANPDPQREVTYGMQTTEEMMEAYVYLETDVDSVTGTPFPILLDPTAGDQEEVTQDLNAIASRPQESDGHAFDWHLVVKGGQRGRLSRPTGSGDHVRIDELAAEGDVRVVVGPVLASRLRSGQARIEVKSDAPRTVGVAWQGGLHESSASLQQKPISTDWSAITIDLPAEVARDEGFVQVSLSGHVAAVELRWVNEGQSVPAPVVAKADSAAPTSPVDPASWQLKSHLGAQATLAKTGNTMHLEFGALEPSQRSWTVQLVRAVAAVEDRSLCRVQFRCRSSAPRSAFLGVFQRHDPWQPLTRIDEIRLSPEWQTVRRELLVMSSDADAEIRLDVGHDESWIEWEAIEVGLEGKPSETANIGSSTGRPDVATNR